MEVKFSNARYEDYYNAIIGKQWADQYKKIFEGQRDYNEKYVINEVDNEKFWVIIAIKNLFGETIRYVDRKYIDVPDPSNPMFVQHICIDPGTYKDVKYQKQSLLTSLYLHKEMDFAAIKVSVFRFEPAPYNTNYNNNSATYINAKLRKLGYNKFEFTNERGMIYGDLSSRFIYNNMKIMIPQDKNSDDLIRLLNGIDNFNNFLCSHSPKLWDTMQSIKNNVNIDF